MAEPTRNPWAELRAAHPGRAFVRTIAMDGSGQVFVEVNAEDPLQFPPAGATVYAPSPAPGIDIAEARDLSRYWNAQPYSVHLREPEPA